MSSAPANKSFVRRLTAKPSAIITGAWIALVLAMAFVPRAFSGQDPSYQDYAKVLKGPIDGHVLGTDTLGRDVWARLVHGTQTTLWGAMIAVIVATLIGVSFGLMGGFLGGWVDMAVMRFSELLFSIPNLIILLFV